MSDDDPYNYDYDGDKDEGHDDYVEEPVDTRDNYDALDEFYNEDGGAPPDVNVDIGDVDVGSGDNSPKQQKYVMKEKTVKEKTPSKGFSIFGDKQLNLGIVKLSPQDIPLPLFDPLWFKKLVYGKDPWMIIVTSIETILASVLSCVNVVTYIYMVILAFMYTNTQWAYLILGLFFSMAFCCCVPCVGCCLKYGPLFKANTSKSVFSKVFLAVYLIFNIVSIVFYCWQAIGIIGGTGFVQFNLFWVDGAYEKPAVVLLFGEFEMIRNIHVNRDTSLKPFAPPLIERKKCFSSGKNLNSREFPLASPTNKRIRTRVYSTSKKIVLCRKKSSRDVFAHLAKPNMKKQPRITRRKMGKKREDQFGQKVVVKVRKLGKCVNRRPMSVAKEDKGKRIIRTDEILSRIDEKTRGIHGKRIMKERNNTASIFKPRKYLTKRIPGKKRDPPNFNLIAGTPSLIEKITTGKGLSEMGKQKKYHGSKKILPVFESSKRRIIPHYTCMYKEHVLKRRLTSGIRRTESCVFPMNLKKTKHVYRAVMRPCTRSSVTYDILSCGKDREN